VGFIFKTINDNMNIGKKFLSDLKLHSDYLKWKEEEGRYETWEDACESIIEGHRQKYGNLPNLEEHLQIALKAIKSKQVLASQRNLQYRFPQIKTNNERLYNCVGVLFNKNDYFQKTFHVLLSGCGLDFSLRKLFIKQLSTIQTRTKGTKTYVIPDSIDGWADSLGVLMSSYFTDNAPFPEYMGYEIKFDFSLIRPKGAFISGGFKAPGPDGLKQSLEKIETLINNWINTRGNIIESILVYDIIMHAADAVLSGGVRRSACSVLIDEDDEEMIQAKLGNWRQTNPQRARSNNAIGLHRNSFSQEKLKSIIDLNQGDNDISFIFVHDEYEVSNPCFSGDMKILTEKGYKTFEEIGENEVSLIDGSGNIKDAKVSISGVKKLIELKFRNRTSIKCTPQHVFLTAEEEEVEAQYLKGQRIAPYLNQTLDFNKEYIKYGFLQGDGCLGRLDSAAHKGLEINLNKKDIEISDLFEIENKQKVYINGYNEILNSLGFNSKPLPERELPLTIREWEEKNLVSFLRGLWSANGSIITNNRISFKSTCKNLIDQLSEILNSLGYNNYYTTNKPKVVTFSNGDYICKESYDLNIADYLSMEKFYNNIGFEQEYKNKALKQLLINKAPVVSSIKEISGIHKVYDFSIKDTVLPWGIVEGVIAHNCREITFRPILEDGRTGFQMCNLTEINASACKTEGEFYSACVAASILGTLQAGYTHFPYLGKDTEDLVRREALIGVSITGWMNNPMLFNPIILSTGAKFVKLINEDIASIININPAARTTTVKPSGNASVILGTASGIHPEHSRRYFRIMQLNKESDTAKWLEENMPVLLENSVWSATNSDYVVYVPIENPEEGFYKKDMKGVKHLEFIKMVQQYWVNEGTNEAYCLKPWLRHSVSCTVIVDDIEKITEYIFSNQGDFKAVSFISDYGDKDFNQAPFTSVSTIEEIVSTYGKGALFVSGLIVDGLHYFGNDLWSACDMILKSDVKIFGTKEQVMLKKYWLSRAKKFANNFFNGNLQQMIYCLKDVHLLHKWEVINREFKPTNFGEILSKPKFKDISDYAAVSCSGGACEIVNIN
jgi:hypothetical protein